MATRKCQGLLFLLLGALLLVACATVEAPGSSPFPYTIEIITPTHPRDAVPGGALLLPLHPLSCATSHRRGHLRLRQEPGRLGESRQAIWSGYAEKG